MRFYMSMLLAVLIAMPGSLWACACGCGVFEVGTDSMFPTHEGGMAWMEYDYLNQNRNWHQDSPSSADNNTDKNLISNFISAGYEYLFNRQWGASLEVPVTNRYFKTTDDDTGAIGEFTHTAIGDIRIHGIYTGLSEDLSTGLTFGLRLPTGDNTYPNFDPDVEIGSGSTDLLLGGYSMGAIGSSPFNWFTDAEMDQPVLHAEGYKPGGELDGAVGTYFNRWRIGRVKIAPLGELLGSHRWSDSGFNADAPDSGFSRLLVAPGVEVDAGPFRIYTDVGFPVYQYVVGQQLVASEYFKMNIGYHF